MRADGWSRRRPRNLMLERGEPNRRHTGHASEHITFAIVSSGLKADYGGPNVDEDRFGCCCNAGVL